ncbi:vinorine synthase-like [Durio zibethinus]|uniref:Vinorine synthase-like n=1 Tax=Durio zibethinus TaxID=66656 RepID=A0A6P6B5W5_DURZI|nr:vinorine synthase-like [Durio zibethinus]
MEIKSEIVSRQTIKPSNPTPPHLKTFKLSLLDQLTPGVHGNMTFFYPSNNTIDSIAEDFSDKSKLLQESISKTLSLFYPLGGRFKDAATIDCNDEGTFFVESKVNIQLSEFLNRPDFNLMDHFLPTTDHKTTELSNGAMFLVRITSFTCGGVAVSLSLTHKLADMSALLALLQSWSSICHGLSYPVTPDLMGEKFLAPNDQLSAMSSSVNIDAEKFVMRRFVFGESKIAELKAKVDQEFREVMQSHPSRVEVVLALIWKCAVANKKQKTGSVGPTALFQAVNLRTRMSPPLPDTAFGNFIWPFMVLAKEEKDLELHELVIQMRKSFNEFNNTTANMFRGEGAPLAVMGALKERGEFFRNNREMTVYKCSSWCRFPLYDTDFGWGKPLWLVSINKMVSNTIALADTRSGDGIEALLTLDEEEMALFEQNEELLKYATLNPSINA